MIQASIGGTIFLLIIVVLLIGAIIVGILYLRGKFSIAPKKEIKRRPQKPSVVSVQSQNDIEQQQPIERTSAPSIFTFDTIREKDKKSHKGTVSQQIFDDLE